MRRRTRLPVLLALMLLATVLTPAAPAVAVSPDMVISQVYGGGGNAGAPFSNDFVELFNRSEGPVAIDGWSIQYSSAAGSSWGNQLTTLEGTVQPGQYFLVQMAAGTTPSGALPEPDDTGTTNMSGSSGKLALVTDSTALPAVTCPTTATIRDLVGFGSSANCFEGDDHTGNLSNTTAAIRLAGGCTDTDQNGTDFAVDAPTPRNSSSPTNACGAPGNAPVTITCPADFTVDEGTGETRQVSATDADGTVTSITLADVDPESVAFTVENLAPATADGGVATADLVVADDAAPGSYAVTLAAANADDPAQTATCTVDVAVIAAGVTLISTIQGDGEESPLHGQVVTVEAIVVGDFQGDGQDQLDGFFVQEEDADADGAPATSEGIFVFDPDAIDVDLGDLVSVTGEVDEFFDQTQIDEVAAVTILSEGNSPPTAATVTLPVAERADLERFEGMRVTFPGDLFVTENFQLGRFGELILAPSVLPQATNVVEPGPAAIALEMQNLLSEIVLDDGRDFQNPDPTPYLGSADDPRGRIGDVTTDLTGVLGFGFDAYRVQPVEPIVFTPSRPRPQEPPEVGGTVQVASFNVLNYYDQPFPSERGANSEFEFERQEAKIVEAIAILDAAVVGLIELENAPADPVDEDTPAQEVLADAVNTELGAAVYDFVDTGAIGTDAIRQAFIYQPGAVRPVGDFAVLDDVDPFDRNSRPPLAQRFEHGASGEQFIAIVNHFKSKSCSGAEGANADQGDGQACFNADRVLAAKELLDWIAEDPYFADEPDVMIIGDLNAYAMEDPIDEIEAAGYTDLLAQFVGEEEEYTFTFDGRQGYLDHALSSSTLTDRVTGAAAWHINADEPLILDYNVEFKSDDQVNELYRDNAFRSSDHDPVVVGLDLVAEPVDLSIAVSDSRDPVGPGQTVVYTVQLGNRGSDEARDIVVGMSFDLPPRTRLSGVVVPEGTRYDQRTNQWSVPALAGGEFVELQIGVTLANDARGPDQIRVRAAITDSANPRVLPQDDQDIETTQVSRSRQTGFR